MISIGKTGKRKIELTEKDLAQAMSLKKHQGSEAHTTIYQHSEVERDWILGSLMRACEAADKEKVFALACQFTGFEKRNVLERELIDRADEFVADYKETTHNIGGEESDGNELEAV